jgi:hypothetical protein
VPATCPCPEPDRSSPCPTSHFLKIHRNINFPFKLGSSKWSHSLRFPHKNTACTSSFPIRITCPAHPILLDLLIRIIFSEEWRALRSTYLEMLKLMFKSKKSYHSKQLDSLNTENMKSDSDIKRKNEEKETSVNVSVHTVFA